MRIIGPAILVVAVGVVLLRAVSTQADGSTPQGLPSVSVNPTFAEPGETIRVTATCRKATTTRTRITSGAFDPTTLRRPTGAPGPTLTDTVVINHVRPGRFRVNSRCDDHSTASTTLTILTAGAPHVVPEGGARTGGGSTAPNRPAPTAAVGTAMLASGLGLVTFTLRRRAARR